MVDYVYKSININPVVVDSYVVTKEPGLQSKYQIEVLDNLIGTSLNRYDDGVLKTKDNLITAQLVTDSSGNTVGIADPVGGGNSPILGVTSFTADDTGTAWAACPDIIQLGATLTSGGTTTVLLEVRTSAGVVSTAATIVADTISQTLSASFATQTFQSFRVRRSSGTGSVTITL